MKNMDNKEHIDIEAERYLYFDDPEFNIYISDLINNDVVLSMKNYIQHGTTTCFEHCINVSYKSFQIAKKINLNAKSVARAGLLHDLFLYDWHKAEKKPLLQKHGFTHPKTALDNATKYFNLNDIEKDIIEKHMWPLTFRHIPKYKESMLVSMVDKYYSTIETFEPLTNKINSYLKTNIYKKGIDN